jgi:hypothetical protein
VILPWEFAYTNPPETVNPLDIIGNSIYAGKNVYSVYA